MNAQSCFVGRPLLILFLCAAPLWSEEIPSMKPMPKSPNAVSSAVSEEEDSVHGIAPIDRGFVSADQAQAIIRQILMEEPRTTILKDIPGYIHAMQKSAFFGFADDMEFWIRDDLPYIDVRSEARLGYSDFGVNRSRIERYRERYAQILP
ncbi:MAG: DUF1499 domain-containing protein [Spirochaetales bacterium]|nr:DUF1499 domain-containing protein [Spirochaetales bacterium]